LSKTLAQWLQALMEFLSRDYEQFPDYFCLKVQTFAHKPDFIWKKAGLGGEQGESAEKVRGRVREKVRDRELGCEGTRLDLTP
jgi:hypothetical protein